MREQFLWLVGISSFLISGLCGGEERQPALKKQPAYETQDVRYCRLVFGPKPTLVTWVALDGDVLYIDRNQNGDLTDPEDRLKVRIVNKEFDWKLIAEGHHFTDLIDPSQKKFNSEDRDVPLLKKHDRYTRFALEYFLRNEEYSPDDPAEKANVEYWIANSEGFVDAFVKVNKAVTQRGHARFAAKAEESPIVFFDGTFAIELFHLPSPKPELNLEFIPGEDVMLRVVVASRGEGEAITWLQNRDLPKHVFPVAEIEVPTKGGTIFRLNQPLDQRAGSQVFQHAITLPEDAVLGKAKLTLTISGSKDLQVAPTILNVPVVESDKLPAP